MTQNAKESLRASTLATLTAGGKDYRYYSLPKLAAELGVDLTRVPVTIRIVLESILRNCDEETIHAESVKKLAGWKANAPREETPFVVSRVILQDLTGVPLLADLAAMRSEAARRGLDPERVEPLVPVDMVVDHSVMIDNFGNPQALTDNMSVEFKRNRERYSFLKWGMQAFKSFGIVPPGFGIVHQVNLEYLARGVFCGKDNTLWPDSVVGTDSHTVMVNGLGVIGWGVGGIEAEAAMLGRPIYMLTPDVVGVHLKGKLPADCTTTDLALTVTQVLRAKKVVGKFVEFSVTAQGLWRCPSAPRLPTWPPNTAPRWATSAWTTKRLRSLRKRGALKRSAVALKPTLRRRGYSALPRPVCTTTPTR